MHFRIDCSILHPLPCKIACGKLQQLVLKLLQVNEAGLRAGCNAQVLLQTHVVLVHLATHIIGRYW